MSTQKALDKITEWLSIATQMQSYLPAGDSVLAHWFKTLDDFKKDLPLLHRMASDALKVFILRPYYEDAPNRLLCVLANVWYSASSVL